MDISSDSRTAANNPRLSAAYQQQQFRNRNWCQFGTAADDLVCSTEAFNQARRINKLSNQARSDGHWRAKRGTNIWLDAAHQDVSRKSMQYHLIDGILSRRGTNDLMMKCISREEGIQLLWDIHSGIYGSHSSWRSIIGKVDGGHASSKHHTRCGSQVHVEYYIQVRCP
jgi:hypothetical protein